MSRVVFSGITWLIAALPLLSSAMACPGVASPMRSPKPKLGANPSATGLEDA